MIVTAMKDHVETFYSSQLPVEIARSAGELLVRTWPRPGITVQHRAEQLLAPGRSYTGPPEFAPRSAIIQLEHRVVAHAMLFARTIHCSGSQPMTVAALSKVCVDASLRGQHLGELVVRTILEPVDNHTFPFALFQTSQGVYPFYRSLGAVEATNRFVNSRADSPDANPWWDDVVLRYPGERPGWPEGEIDLLGPAF